jgi:hypothetical protein
MMAIRLAVVSLVVNIYALQAAADVRNVRPAPTTQQQKSFLIFVQRQKQSPGRSVARSTRVTSEIARLIAPFRLEEAREGFKGEFESSGMKSNFGVGAMSVQTITKPRPGGGKVSAEVAYKNGMIDSIAFKLLPGDAGFQVLWNTEPTVVLSQPISTGIGFAHAVIRKDGGAATEVDLAR